MVESSAVRKTITSKNDLSPDEVKHVFEENKNASARNPHVEEKKKDKGGLFGYGIFKWPGSKQKSNEIPEDTSPFSVGKYLKRSEDGELQVEVLYQDINSKPGTLTLKSAYLHFYATDSHQFTIDYQDILQQNELKMLNEEVYGIDVSPEYQQAHKHRMMV